MKSKGHTMEIHAGTNGHAVGAQLHKKLKRKDYEKELARLHAELVKLQHWVVEKRLRVCIVFEGRDGAGKGGTIKAITERVSPRVFRVIALPTPNEREKTQLYFQRYIQHLQRWVVAKGLKVCILFEGRDGAGKGGTIKAITERVSPRVFRVIALPT